MLLYVDSVTVESSTITGNMGSVGGGIFFSGSSLTLVDTSVQDNVAADSDGLSGGLQLYTSGTSVTAFNVNMSGTNEPYDVSCQDPNGLRTSYGLYDYGTDVSFECEYEVGCWDL